MFFYSLPDTRDAPVYPPPEIVIEKNERGNEVPVFKTNNTNTSAQSVADQLGLSDLYIANREWAEEQAERQMDFQTRANQAAMKFSADQAEIQRNWLENMSNSSYQRAVGDLEKAGLNPILAYSQGGASVPSVSAASGITSSGSKASMSDTGYDYYKLIFSLVENFTNNATKIATSIID